MSSPSRWAPPSLSTPNGNPQLIGFAAPNRPFSPQGIGVDRLVMVFCDEVNVRDVLLFPQMKPEKPESVEG